jgi:hypothetical protein
MIKLVKRVFWAVAILSGACLAGCASDQNAIYQSANHTVQLMKVGPIGEYDSKSMPHALGAGGPTFGAIASQYRWVHVQAITKVDRDTYIHTIARVPDNIPHRGRGFPDNLGFQFRQGAICGCFSCGLQKRCNLLCMSKTAVPRRGRYGGISRPYGRACA